MTNPLGKKTRGEAKVQKNKIPSVCIFHSNSMNMVHVVAVLFLGLSIVEY